MKKHGKNRQESEANSQKTKKTNFCYSMLADWYEVYARDPFSLSHLSLSLRESDSDDASSGGRSSSSSSSRRSNTSRDTRQARAAAAVAAVDPDLSMCRV